MNILRLLTSIVAFLLFFFVSLSPAYAGSINITNNTYFDDAPRIGDGKIAWSAQDGSSNNDFEIYLYDIATGTTTKVTDNNSDDLNPSQINEGKFIWTGSDGNDTEIYLYDIATNIITQITDNTLPDDTVNYHDMRLISGGKIVWQGVTGTGTGSDSDYDIFLYDIATGTTTQITNNTNNFSDYEPQINEGKVVWRGDTPGGDFEIYLYDIATGVTTQVSDNDYYDFGAMVEDGKVVWSGMVNGGPPENFIYDIATGTTTRLTNNDSFDSIPQINNGKVVWSGFDGNDREIYLYDIATGTTTQITNNTFSDDHAEINDGKVVWDGCNDDCEIYAYDIATGITTQITNNTIGDFEPLTSNGEITWSIFDNEDYEVALWDGIIPPNNTPVGSNVTYNENGVQLTFSQVDIAGDTTVTRSASGTQPPTGFRLGAPPTYFNISTTATFSGNVEVCIDYNSLNMPGNESNFKLMHYEPGTGWINITSSLNTTNNVICGITTSFSAFSVMIAPTIQDLINRVQEMHLNLILENSLNLKLRTALIAENLGLHQTAINTLEAFITEVEAQRGKKITNQQANELHSFAANLIKLIQGNTQF